jgi:hypothetical protein
LSFLALVISSRFGKLLPYTLAPLCGSLCTRQDRGMGIPCIDSTSLPVCHNRHSTCYQSRDGYTTRGKYSMGWYCASSYT